ncbi:MAG: hypothetical protein AB1779_03735 [Candidatus Thermoplasmatota archaeon]
MEQKLKTKKKNEEEIKLEFEAGKVFSPDEAKKEDFNLDLDKESDRYKARKGEGGDRTKWD